MGQLFSGKEGYQGFRMANFALDQSSDSLVRDFHLSPANIPSTHTKQFLDLIGHQPRIHKHATVDLHNCLEYRNMGIVSATFEGTDVEERWFIRGSQDCASLSRLVDGPLCVDIKIPS